MKSGTLSKLPNGSSAAGGVGAAVLAESGLRAQITERGQEQLGRGMYGPYVHWCARHVEEWSLTFKFPHHGDFGGSRRDGDGVTPPQPSGLERMVAATAKVAAAARAWHWHCAGCLAASRSYSTFRTRSPSFSPVPSTSAHTLDHAALQQPPLWDELVPADLIRSPSPAKRPAEWVRPHERLRTARAQKGSGKGHGKGKGLHDDWKDTNGRRQQQQRHRPRPPAVDPASISPFLPLVTRERNFLLANLRQALHSRRQPARPRRGVGSGRRTSLQLGRKNAAVTAVWDPDQVWSALARVLRYPEHVPTLPHSQLPSSTRSPAIASFSSARSDSQSADQGFFTSAHIADDANEHEGREDYVGRTKIDLSLPELRRAFTVFASATPRTRNGLNRLLVVAELIATHPSQAGHRRRLGPAQVPVAVDDPYATSGEDRLQGGGAGLRDKDWAALVMFVGANLRTARADPEVRSALALFSQRLELQPATPTLGSRDGLRRLYTSLLFVVGRAKMWELFEQVLRRMSDAGLDPDAATLVELIKREEQRGAPISAVWALFERGLATAEVSPDGSRALWTAALWMLGKRGLLGEALRIYAVMKGDRDEVDLAELRPVDEHTAALDSPPGLTVSVPRPDDRVVTSLIQVCAYRGDLAGAVRILHDILGSHAAADQAEDGASCLRPAVHHFVPIFRAFARYGAGKRNGPRDGAPFDRTTLGGARIGSHALKRGALAFAALSSRPSSRPPGTTSAPADPTSNPFTLPALSVLFDSFLALQPPPTAAHAGLPFLGGRTAPSAKDVFWVLFAFERLSNDPHVVLEAWAACERKFAGPTSTPAGDRSARTAGWTGWRMDKRVAKLVGSHRAVVAERQRRLDELQ